MADPFATFKSLEQFYPGSRKKRGSVPATVPAEPEWDERPFLKRLGGRDVEMYTVSALARAIHKSTHSVRLYESNGYLPKTPYRTPTREVNGKPRLGRRLYTREMILAVVESLAERGLLEALRIEWGDHPELPREIAGKWRLLQGAQTTDQMS